MAAPSKEKRVKVGLSSAVKAVNVKNSSCHRLTSVDEIKHLAVIFSFIISFRVTEKL